MPITEHQRKQRQKHLGSSDSPQVLGVSPWGTASDVYYQKTMPLPDDEPTEAMQTGTRLEPVILDWAQEQLGVKFHRNQYRVAPDGILSANMDALVVDKNQGIEAKYVGPNSLEEWGEPGTDQVPVYVAAQVQHQMYVVELEVVWVPVLMARFRPMWEMYEVRRDEQIIDALVEADTRFWNEHIVPRLPPDPSELPPLELLKRLNREPEEVVDLPDYAIDLVEAYEDAKARGKAAKATVGEAMRAVLAALDNAEAGRLPDGRLITYREQTRREHITKASTFRVLRIQKAREKP